jgi:hypothetical protein|uniref:Uncharacterized protein n=1 Tax=Eutreptiella gymnastica TaxID=73025 RepID=A0A7S4GIH3_9EUGL
MALFGYSKLLVAQVAGIGIIGYGGYTLYDDWQRSRQEAQMYKYTAEELVELGEKVLKDFETKGYSQIPLNKVMGMRIRDTYWGLRSFIEFSAQRYNLTETVYDRISCYHLEAPKDGTDPLAYDPWHFDGGPGPNPSPELVKHMDNLHQDLTFVGDKVTSALAAAMKNEHLAAIAIDQTKRSECIFKYYPDETPLRPANCGQYGLLYLLPSTTMMDSPLCPKTFEVYDREKNKYVDLEKGAPDLVCITVIPAIPLLKYTRKFKPTPWRVVSDRDSTHDGRKTIEYAYATETKVPPRGVLRKEDQKYFGVQDGFRRKKDLKK